MSPRERLCAEATTKADTAQLLVVQTDSRGQLGHHMNPSDAAASATVHSRAPESLHRSLAADHSTGRSHSPLRALGKCEHTSPGKALLSSYMSRRSSVQIGADSLSDHARKLPVAPLYSTVIRLRPAPSMAAI
eukprot:6209410-Pleurochrysis_carterae.AAC.1